MKPFPTRDDAIRWLKQNSAGHCWLIVSGRIRGYDPADQKLYVIAEIDPTPMW